ncbi:acyltransferase family protein [Microvenator marinus]|jgi:1-acyl-sn-glycerol-3-phosphate acyltransferase|uniref:Acyltransferase family protein n=1 Tax=Microvenator marinus TaxID=2600177 RepID=A0A5B8XMZ4_9DELT|nr:lysophospholipid acyltransferase family protein [Microvenator marinus]QED26378.1 acyltransferase family protein [Microvenator marinus]
MRWLVDEDVQSRVRRIELPFNKYGIDPYGISQSHLDVFFSTLGWLYKHYFRVRTYGADRVPARGRAMLVGNHSGGVAVDGAMVLASMLLEKEPPRLAQGMAEKFLNRLPVSSQWTNRVGQFTGLPEHASRLLEDERLLMVFPEGARGTAKLYPERNSLVRFGTGFVRLALETKTPIIPFAFIGGGEVIPTVHNSLTLGRLIGAPYVPITPYLLPLPRPVPCEIYYGEPLVFEGTGKEDDEEIGAMVARVKTEIGRLIELGLERRDRRDSPMTEWEQQ